MNRRGHDVFQATDEKMKNGEGHLLSGRQQTRNQEDFMASKQFPSFLIRVVY
jgi:hypothetical protein